MRDDMLRATYEQALGFPDYLAQVRANAAHFRRHYQRLAPVADDPTNAVFPVGVRILVLCEPYCGDCVVNLPLIARLAEASGNTDLRVTSRDRHQALADRFPGRGGLSRVPTVILCDAQWTLLGFWSERGASDRDWMDDFTRSDPLPDITLDDGLPAGEFADWLERRLAGQLPAFYAGNWRDVRDELGVLAKAPRATMATALSE